MTLEEIDAEITRMCRPFFVNLADAINPAKVRDMRAQQAAWDEAHPVEAAERLRMLAQAGELQRAAEAASRNQAMRKSDLERVRRQAGDRIADNLESPREEPHLATARQWLAGTEWSLSLIGRAGNGKTFAAAWVSLNSGLRPTTWLHAPEAAARPLYGPEATANADRASNAALLVIDDLGAELASAGWKSWLESVLGNRYARRRRTVITSNLDQHQYAARLEARLTDRLKEGCVFESNGRSLRPRGQRQLEVVAP